MGLKLTTTGSFDKLERFLQKAAKMDVRSVLERYGQEGVVALAAATPQDSGLTSNSWSFEIEQKAGSVAIYWKNSNTVNGAPIAILLQYGHGTGTGGYVQGRDYINPAIQPIFDRIADGVWKEVTQT